MEEVEAVDTLMLTLLRPCRLHRRSLSLLLGNEVDPGKMRTEPNRRPHRGSPPGARIELQRSGLATALQLLQRRLRPLTAMGTNLEKSVGGKSFTQILILKQISLLSRRAK